MPPDLDALLAEADRLRPLARRLARDEAEDLVQDSVETALRGGPRDGGALRGWLRRVLLNQHALRRRGEARRRTREQARAGDGADPESPEAVVQRAEHRRLLAEAVLRVREPYRRTLLWHYFEGWSAARIARHDGVTPSTVRGRLKRGVDALRVDLEQSWGRDWRAHCLALAGAGWRGKLVGAGLGVAAAVALIVVLVPPSSPSTEAPSAEAALASVAGAESSSDRGAANRLPAAGAAAGPADREAVAGAPDSDKRFAPRPHRIILRAVDAVTDEPIAGAEVRLMTDFENVRGENEYRPEGLDSQLRRARREPPLPVVATTGADGRAEVALGADSRWAYLATSTHHGLDDVQPMHRPGVLDDPASLTELEIPLHAAVTVDVLVVDESGQPLADAPVAWCVAQPSADEPRPADPRHGEVITVGRTGADGRARLSFPGQEWDQLRSRLGDRGFVLRTEVQLRHPGGGGPSTAVETGTLARLIAPATGTLTVEVAAPRPGLVAVLSTPLGDEVKTVFRDSSRVEGLARGAGRFVFPHLPLGRSFTLSLGPPGPYYGRGSTRRIPVEGPTPAQPERVIRVDDSEGTWLRGRVVLPSGEACAFTEATFELLAADFSRAKPSGFVFRLDEDGSFAVRLDERREKRAQLAATSVEPLPEIAYLAIRARASGIFLRAPMQLASPPGDALVPVRPDILETGAELGVVQLGTAPLLASGRVVDAEGTPLAHCVVHLRGESDPAFTGERSAWWDPPGWRAKTDRAGRFQFAEAQPDESHEGVLYHLQAISPYGSLRTAKRPIALGSAAVELRFPPLGSLAFSYRLPRTELYARASLEPVDPQQPRVSLDYLEWWEDDPDHLHRRLHEAVPEGEYDFVLSFTKGETLQTVSLARVQIRAGETAAPDALQELDILSRIRAFRYDLVDDRGVPVTASARLEFPRQTEQGLIRGRGVGLPQLAGSHLLFPGFLDSSRLTAEERRRALLFVRGYCPAVLEEPERDQRIVLQPEVELRIDIAGAPPLQDEADWELALTWADAPAGHHSYANARIQRWSGEPQTLVLPALGRYELAWSRSFPGSRSLVHRETTRFGREHLDGTATLHFPDALRAPPPEDGD